VEGLPAFKGPGATLKKGTSRQGEKKSCLAGGESGITRLFAIASEPRKRGGRGLDVEKNIYEVERKNSCLKRRKFAFVVGDRKGGSCGAIFRKGGEKSACGGGFQRPWRHVVEGGGGP